MQPHRVALLVTLLPLIAVHGAYLMSAMADLVPTCIPYIDGCTSISRSARRGDAIFLFRAIMIAVYRFLRRYGVIVYFSCTPLAQLILLKKISDLRKRNIPSFIDHAVYKAQIILCILMVTMGVISGALDLLQWDSFESENILEWNFALCMTLYFGGSYLTWKSYGFVISTSIKRK